MKQKTQSEVTVNESKQPEQYKQDGHFIMSCADTHFPIKVATLVGPDWKETGQRIVTAVNSFDELVGLLNFIRESYWDLMTEETVNNIDAAIAKATNSK